MPKNHLKLLLAVASGLAIFAAFPPLAQSYLAWVSLLPFLFLISLLTGNKETFLYSYLTGIVFFSALLYWLPHVSVPGSIALVLIMGLYFAFFGVVTGIVLKYRINLLVIPCAWIVMEYLRGYIFTGFSWGLLGNSQYRNINIIQVADITGVYGISFLLVLVNTAFFAFLRKDERKLRCVITAVVLVFLTMLYGVNKAGNFKAQKGPVLAVIQGNIPQSFKFDPAYSGTIMEKYGVMTREAARENPDLIVWPETAYPYLIAAGETGGPLSVFASETNVPIMAGAVSEKDGSYFNSAVFFSEKGEPGPVYNKTHLVPYGEYLPFERFVPSLRGYIDKPVGDFSKGREYTLFKIRSFSKNESEKGAIVRSTSYYGIGVLICYEDIFPYLARDFVREGADILLNMTNDAWFGKTAAPEQHLQSSVFRAVENRVPVVRAANTGVSCFIDPTGAVYSRVKMNGKDVFVDGFSVNAVRMFGGGRTFYTIYGDVFVCFCGAFGMFVCLLEPIVRRYYGRR